MGLHAFQQFAYRHFGAFAMRKAKENPRLGVTLQRAMIPMRPDAWLASTYLAMLFTVAMGYVLLVMIFGAVFAGVLDIPLLFLLAMVPAPMVLAIATYALLMVYPEMRAKARARDIDAKIPYALNYIAAMSSAGVTPTKVLEDLSENPLYGEITREAERIDRDLNLLGHDIVTALYRAVERTPSQKFQDFLQGAITALTSGGDLTEYFLSKSDQYLYENRQEQEKFLDGLGVLAESFVVVAVAAPLFLIVLLSVMTTFGSSSDAVLRLGYVIILGLLPLSQTGFALAIKTMTPEA